MRCNVLIMIVQYISPFYIYYIIFYILIYMYVWPHVYFILYRCTYYYYLYTCTRATVPVRRVQVS